MLLTPTRPARTLAARTRRILQTLRALYARMSDRAVALMVWLITGTTMAGAQKATELINDTFKPATAPICDLIIGLPSSYLPGVGAAGLFIIGAVMYRFGNQRGGIPMMAGAVVWYLLFTNIIAILALVNIQCAVK